MLEVEINAPPQGVFFPGSEVSGKLRVRVNEPTRNLYKKIQVTLVGLARVFWTVSPSRTFSSKEVYIELSTIVWMKEPVPTQELHNGMNSFPFRFQLPAEGLPSSFDGSFGWIRYYVEGKIGTTDNRNHRVKALITVVEDVDVNASQLQTPLCTEKQKTLGCFLHASAPISLNVELPYQGFCDGDVIPLKVMLKNGSSRQLRLRAQLLQAICYTAEGNHRYTQTVVAGVESGQLEPRTTSMWNPEELVVPAAGHIIPTLRSCRIINVDYILKVSAMIPWRQNLTVDIAVTIGRVPLYSSTSAQNSVPMIFSPQFVPSQPTSSVYPTQGIYPPSHQPPKFVPPNPGSSTVKMGDFQSDPPPSYEDVVANPNNFVTGF